MVDAILIAKQVTALRWIWEIFIIPLLLVGRLREYILFSRHNNNNINIPKPAKIINSTFGM